MHAGGRAIWSVALAAAVAVALMALCVGVARADCTLTAGSALSGPKTYSDDWGYARMTGTDYVGGDLMRGDAGGPGVPDGTVTTVRGCHQWCATAAPAYDLIVIAPGYYCYCKDSKHTAPPSLTAPRTASPRPNTTLATVPWGSVLDTECPPSGYDTVGDAVQCSGSAWTGTARPHCQARAVSSSTGVSVASTGGGASSTAGASSSGSPSSTGSTSSTAGVGSTGGGASSTGGSASSTGSDAPPAVDAWAQVLVGSTDTSAANAGVPPPPRALATLTATPAGLVLIGGYRLRTAADAPRLDPVSVLYGGGTWLPVSPADVDGQELGDAWFSADGQSWTPVQRNDWSSYTPPMSAPQNPATAVFRPRCAHATTAAHTSAADPNVLWVYGGYGKGDGSELWTAADAGRGAWRLLMSSTLVTGPYPGPRAGHTLTCLTPTSASAPARLVLIGGVNPSQPAQPYDGAQCAVWYTADGGATWNAAASCAATFGARVGHAVALLSSSAGAGLYLMGGLSAGQQPQNDVWVAANADSASDFTFTRVTSSAGWTPRAFFGGPSLPAAALFVVGSRGTPRGLLPLATGGHAGPNATSGLAAPFAALGLAYASVPDAVVKPVSVPYSSTSASWQSVAGPWAAASTATATAHAGVMGHGVTFFCDHFYAVGGFARNVTAREERWWVDGALPSDAAPVQAVRVRRVSAYDLAQSTWGAAPGAVWPPANTLVPQPCPAGTYGCSTADSGVCHACPTGRVSAVAGSASCTACPTGTAPNADSTACCTADGCDRPGCARGKYLNADSGACALCPVGTYSGLTGLTSAAECRACPTATPTSRPDRTSCSPPPVVCVDPRLCVASTAGDSDTESGATGVAAAPAGGRLTSVEVVVIAVCSAVLVGGFGAACVCTRCRATRRRQKALGVEAAGAAAAPAPADLDAVVPAARSGRRGTAQGATQSRQPRYTWQDFFPVDGDASDVGPAPARDAVSSQPVHVRVHVSPDPPPPAAAAAH